jgi:hypothetical protein
MTIQTAACQLIHAAIRESAKGGGALLNALDLVLITADAVSQPQTSKESLEALCSSIPDEDLGETRDLDTPMDWLEPLPFAEAIRSRRHTEVSQDPRYTHQRLAASD